MLKDSGDDARAVFLREALCTAQFTHDNVVGLIGVVTVGEPVLMAMQYCSQGSLKAVLQRIGHEAPTPFPEARLVAYCKDVTSGMAFLALHKFIHRDLAARNGAFGFLSISGRQISKITLGTLSRRLSDRG